MDDDELQRIREKKIREMEEKMHGREGSAGKLLHVDQARFTQMLAEHPRLVVDFWAEWCGPCRMVAPVIEDLAREMAGQVSFGKCNTDHNQNLAAQFGISAIPTILLFSQGRMIDRVIGAYPKDALRGRIVKAFGIV
ncbi:MAG: thioredoxin [Methanolinea sp.]|nr:thioredoxin [Methanolinea sp.]